MSDDVTVESNVSEAAVPNEESAEKKLELALADSEARLASALAAAEEQKARADALAGAVSTALSDAIPAGPRQRVRSDHCRALSAALDAYLGVKPAAPAEPPSAA